MTVLLLAQTPNRVGPPDSYEIILNLRPQLFSKSEIEFLVSPDPIKEVKNAKNTMQVPIS